jgi:hypothetical protein
MLAAPLEPLTNHPRDGTRQWSVRELGILRQRAFEGEASVLMLVVLPVRAAQR